MSGKDRSSKGLLLVRLVRPLGPQTSRIAILIVVLSALGGGTYFLWQRYGHTILNRPEFVLTADRIEVTPRPPWIPTDIRARAFADGGLSNLSFTQVDLSVLVADAFAMHPWVAKVNYTKKKHGRIIVGLDYRKPVAMVLVDYEEKLDDGSPVGRLGRLPIDADGVVLPTDFTMEQADGYLLVQARDAWPAGLAGTPWGDVRIHGAGRIAAALQDHWRELGLIRIVAADVEQNGTHTPPPSFLLMTRDGDRIPWGHAPSQETTNEPSVAAKVERLVQHFQRDSGGNLRFDGSPLDLSQPERHAIERSQSRRETARNSVGLQLHSIGN